MTLLVHRWNFGPVRNPPGPDYEQSDKSQRTVGFPAACFTKDGFQRGGTMISFSCHVPASHIVAFLLVSLREMIRQTVLDSPPARNTKYPTLAITSA